MGRQTGWWRTLILAAPAAMCFAGGARAENETAWLDISGESRIRYETLGNQFRAGGAGGDQFLALRSLLKIEADLSLLTVGVELQDARGYLDDSGTPISGSFVNPLDILQAYVRVPLGDVFGPGSDSAVQIGRFTLDIGSRRFVERNNFRNTINNYTGAYWTTRWPDLGTELHAFYTAPVNKEPFDRDDRGDNRFALDEEQAGRRFWGAHLRLGDLVIPDLYTDVFTYGLDERDTQSLQTPDRDLTEAGVRIYVPPETSRPDVEIEAAYRWGTRHATAGPDDTADLDVSAWTLHAEIGYTLDHPWAPRVVIDYDLATGDDDPDDRRFGQYERFFGTRRGDLGNTSIHGPLTRANLSAPGGRVLIKPTGRMDARLAYKAAFLASDIDVWTVARLRDPSGRSGSFIGHGIDGRLRYWLVPQYLRGEIGGSVLIKGRFAQTAPGAPDTGDTLYGYAQLTAFF